MNELDVKNYPVDKRKAVAQLKIETRIKHLHEIRFFNDES